MAVPEASDDVVQAVPFNGELLKTPADVLSCWPYVSLSIRVNVLKTLSDAICYSRVVYYTDDAALLARGHFEALPFDDERAVLR